MGKGRNEQPTNQECKRIMVKEVKILAGKGLIVEIDGVKYRKKKGKYYSKDKCKHLDYIEMEPFDYDEHTKILKEIGEKLKDKVPPERVVEELLKGEKTEDLKKLSKKLDSGEVRVKPHNGCLGLTFKNTKKKKSQYMNIMN